MKTTELTPDEADATEPIAAYCGCESGRTGADPVTFTDSPDGGIGSPDAVIEPGDLGSPAAFGDVTVGRGGGRGTDKAGTPPRRFGSRAVPCIDCK